MKTLKELLQPNDWHNIYKDECNDTFLILRGMEVFVYSDTKLRVLFYNPWQFRKYKKICHFEDPWQLDDGIVDCYADINDLQKIGKLKSFCLTDNTPLITAWSNDENYDFIFVRELDILAEKGDTLLVISGSGKSTNILNAARWGLNNNLKVIALIGGDGGYIIRKKGIHILHIPVDMLHVEDISVVFGHILADLLSL